MAETTLQGVRNVGTGQEVQSVNVSTSATVIAAANTLRVAILIVNSGTNDVFIGVDVVPAVDKGILLGKNGGSLSMDATIISTGIIRGITKTGTALVELQEFNV